MILLFIYPSMKKKTGQTGDPVSSPPHQKGTRWTCAQCLPPAPALGLDTAHARAQPLDSPSAMDPFAPPLYLQIIIFSFLPRQRGDAQ